MQKISDSGQRDKALQQNPDGMPAPSDTERQYEQNHEYRGFRVCDLREAFMAVASKTNWRAAWEATVPTIAVARVRAAVDYFHADEPYVIRQGRDTVTLAGKGYQAWS